MRTARSVYGVELDYTLDGLGRLDALLRTDLRVGRYRAEDFPADLALSLACYVGETLQRLAPSSRWGTPDDLKGIVVFLASAASDYINGYTIAVDGGWLAR